MCDGSSAWALERNKAKRAREAAEKGSHRPQPPSDPSAVRAAFQRAAEQDSAQPLSADQEERRQDMEQRAEDEENEDLFADYEPRHYKQGQRHPDAIVETTSLSFAELPPISCSLHLPKEIYAAKSEANPLGGALSRAQLETVAYACQRHEAFLPNGERAGFFLGDGVGLGKGRQVSGASARPPARRAAALRQAHPSHPQPPPKARAPTACPRSLPPSLSRGDPCPSPLSARASAPRPRAPLSSGTARRHHLRELATLLPCYPATLLPC